ncbi:hypothetical protein DMX01_21080 [Pseudomonas fulva]|nr:hypothetical protein DMX01_21080 [Pseudomonas fulva]PYC09507.1 hypothetical protein DMX00_21170 [Pseudomonas fulva]
MQQVRQPLGPDRQISGMQKPAPAIDPDSDVNSAIEMAATGTLLRSRRSFRSRAWAAEFFCAIK